MYSCRKYCINWLHYTRWQRWTMLKITKKKNTPFRIIIHFYMLETRFFPFHLVGLSDFSQKTFLQKRWIVHDDGAVFNKIKQQIDKLVTSHSLFGRLSLFFPKCSNFFPCSTFLHTMWEWRWSIKIGLHK